MPPSSQPASTKAALDLHGIFGVSLQTLPMLQSLTSLIRPPYRLHSVYERLLGTEVEDPGGGPDPPARRGR